MLKKLGVKMFLLQAKQNEKGNDEVNGYKLNYYIIKKLNQNAKIDN